VAELHSARDSLDELVEANQRAMKNILANLKIQDRARKTAEERTAAVETELLFARAQLGT
jgi:hypothetical protein